MKKAIRRLNNPDVEIPVERVPSPGETLADSKIQEVLYVCRRSVGFGDLNGQHHEWVTAETAYIAPVVDGPNQDDE